MNPQQNLTYRGHLSPS